LGFCGASLPPLFTDPVRVLSWFVLILADRIREKWSGGGAGWWICRICLRGSGRRGHADGAGCGTDGAGLGTDDAQHGAGGGQLAKFVTR